MKWTKCTICIAGITLLQPESEYEYIGLILLPQLIFMFSGLQRVNKQ